MIPKFKVWHIKEKRMFDVRRINFNDESVIVYDQGFLNRPNGVRKIQLFEPGRHNPAMKAILIQSTNLKDKNGVEIFEGDIIKVVAPNCRPSDPMLVFKKDGAFWLGSSYRLLCGERSETLEVIGNIHENPNLIKEG